jgi:hypothetical protein
MMILFLSKVMWRISAMQYLPVARQPGRGACAQVAAGFTHAAPGASIDTG